MLLRSAAAILLTLLALTSRADAALTTYLAVDSGAGPGDPRPLSDAAALSFTTAATLIGPTTTVNFESIPVGSFSSLTIAPGVTVNSDTASSGNLSIRDSPVASTSIPLYGFNTTANGSHFINFLGGSATFTFAQGVQAFGAYFTGLQPSAGTSTIRFNDGSSQTVNIPSGPNNVGGISFAGFTDTGTSIVSITIQAGANGGDIIGLDDVTFGPRALATPEPSTLALAVSGLLPLGLVWRKRQQGRANQA